MRRELQTDVITHQPRVTGRHVFLTNNKRPVAAPLLDDVFFGARRNNHHHTSGFIT